MHALVSILVFAGAATAAIGTIAVTVLPQRARIAALLAQAVAA